MKTIGLLGGMSWQSTALYYRLLNKGINDRLGKMHSARIVMLSVDFQEIEQLMTRGDWQQAGDLLIADARRAENAGADFLLLCTNTMHKIADRLQGAISIPLLHIADATAHKLASRNVAKIGLLGTRFTMVEDFYRARLHSCRGIDAIIPSGKDLDIVHDIIFQELCQGIINDSSRQEYLRIIDTLRQEGAEGIVLGCTEICLLVSEQDTSVPLYDTTTIHVEAAINLALS